jgi:hypothetical protein
MLSLLILCGVSLLVWPFLFIMTFLDESKPEDVLIDRAVRVVSLFMTAAATASLYSIFWG